MTADQDRDALAVVIEDALRVANMYEAPEPAWLAEFVFDHWLAARDAEHAEALAARDAVIDIARRYLHVLDGAPGAVMDDEVDAALDAAPESVLSEVLAAARAEALRDAADAWDKWQSGGGVPIIGGPSPAWLRALAAEQGAQPAPLPLDPTPWRSPNGQQFQVLGDEYWRRRFAPREGYEQDRARYES